MLFLTISNNETPSNLELVDDVTEESDTVLVDLLRVASNVFCVAACS